VDELLMTPDRNLARYTAGRTGKKIHYWDGFCPFHDTLTAEDVHRARRQHPDAVFMAHPECRTEVLELADIVASTSGMIRKVGESKARAFIVGTEVGILHPLRRRYPDRAFYPASERMVCGDMKKITPEDILRSLETMGGEVKVPEAVRIPALRAVQRMIDVSA
jgi:quinolinate synthase